MFSPDIVYLVNNEKIKDLRREGERHQLIKTARLGRPGHRVSFQRMAGWLRSRMVTWGSIPHRYDQGSHQTVTQRG